MARSKGDKELSAYEKIEAEYERRPRQEPFLYYVRLYHARGFVFSRPDFFVMGRPVPRTADPARILEDREAFHGEKCDCWYLMAAAGNMARMWQVAPWELPWFCWTRLSDPLSSLVFVEAERLKRLCPPDLSNLKEP